MSRDLSMHFRRHEGVGLASSTVCGIELVYPSRDATVFAWAVTCEACILRMTTAELEDRVGPAPEVMSWASDVPVVPGPRDAGGLPSIVVVRGGDVLVDGVPVPGLIAEDGVSIEVGSVVSWVSVRLLAERVELVDRVEEVGSDG